MRVEQGKCQPSAMRLPPALLVSTSYHNHNLQQQSTTHKEVVNLRARRYQETQRSSGCGNAGMFMSSLDMVGFSITLMRMTPQRALRLDASHSAPAWPAAPAVHDPSKVPTALVWIAVVTTICSVPPFCKNCQRQRYAMWQSFNQAQLVARRNVACWVKCSIYRRSLQFMQTSVPVSCVCIRRARLLCFRFKTRVEMLRLQPRQVPHAVSSVCCSGRCRL